MTLANVLAKLTFYGSDATWTLDPDSPVTQFSSADEDAIRAYITELYTNSPVYAAAILDDAANLGLILVGEAAAGSIGFQQPGSPSYLGFNLDDIDHLYYFNDKGVLVQENPLLTIIHELSHHAHDTEDPQHDLAAQNAGGFDFKGGTVIEQNQVATEMGLLNNIQASYEASLVDNSPDDPRFSLLAAGVSYTNNEQIDVARLGFDEEDDVLDMSNDGASRDLLFGFGGDDNLDGGGGRDFLYGGEDDDTLWGGTGADYIDGGGGGDRIDIGLEITMGSASYSIQAIAPSGAETRTGFQLINGADASDSDRVFEVEHLDFTDNNDTLTLLGDVSLFGNMDLTVDLRGASVGMGQDVVDATGATTGVYINLGTGGARGMDQQTDLGYFAFLGRIVTIAFTPNDLYIMNGNEARGSQYSDILRASSGDEESGEGYSALYGNGGNDLLIGAGWESHLYGGNGDDRFEIGASTYVEDAEDHDAISYCGIPIFGGVQHGWANTNTAYWSPFQTLLTAFPVIGSSLILAAASWLDTPFMKFAAFQLNGDGDLVMQLGWGHGGLGIIRDYRLDLDTGAASAGVVVFSTEKGWDTFIHFTKFLNLAMKAGFGIGITFTYDPLVLDLDGDGFELSTEQNGRVYFEFDTDGFGERSGWVEKDDGFLALDANANGKIDNITELFGNETTSGFTMLAAYDLNTDGVINASDAVYADLRVWRDLDQDGVTDSGELFTLATLGIVSITLASSAPAEPTFVGDSQIVRTGTFNWAGGGTGGIADVAFSINHAATQWLGDNTVSSSAALLPELKGFGTVKDLRVAMTGDAVLEGLVDDFTGSLSTDLDVLKADAEAILYRWAGVQAVAADAIGSNGFDARKLAFLEAYSGYTLMERDGSGDPLLTNIAEVEALWADQVTRLTLRLVVQGPLADVFDGITYHADLDLLVADTATSLGDLYARLLDDLPSDPGDALEQWQGWAPLLGAMAEAMVRSDNILVRGDYIAMQLLAGMDGIDQPLAFETLAEALGVPNLRIGTGGNDSLTRGAAEDMAVYLGNGGTDTIDGGGGQDVYIFGETIGHVTIDDEEAKPTGDRIIFAFLNADDVTLARDGDDLLITVISTGETIRVLGQFADVVPLAADLLLSSNKGVEDIQFADGTVFETPEIMSAVGTGTSGNDHMIGTMHSDVFLGGLGDDLLEGGDDADLYVVKAGEGNDVIHDVQSTVLLRAADMLIFGDGIAPSDLTYTRTGDLGDDLLIAIGDEGQSILIEDQFAYTSLGYNYMLAPNSRIEAFAFSNYGDNWGNSDLQQRLIADVTTAGNDTTRGFGDDDWFGASAGNDLLIGMDGQDVYEWGAGAGNDVIDEQSRYIDINVGLGGLSLSLDADTVLFGAGIVQAGIVFSRPTAANDLVVTILSTGETLTVTDQFAGFQTGMLGPQWLDRVEWFQFADGTRISWQAVLADVTTGGAGDDHLWGDLSADTMDGGAGNDVLSGRGYGDTYMFGLGDGHDIVADDNASILGDGFITLDTSPDVLALGPGIAPSDIGFERDGVDIILVIGAGGDRVTLQGQDDYFHTGVFGALSYNRIEEIHFDNGTIWTWQELNARVLAAATTSGDDDVQGFMMADRFEASAGDDVLRGGDSGDIYVFGAGSGHDIIREDVSNVLYGDFDTVEFGAGVLPAGVAVSRDGDDLIMTLAGGDTLTIENEFLYSAGYTWHDVELFTFMGGAEWTKADVQVMLLAATSGNDHLLGFASDDALDGLAGDDVLEGGDGSDTYSFGFGSGHDVVREWVTNTNVGEDDRLVFGPGVLVGDVSFSRDANDLVVTLSSGDTLRIEGQFNFSSWFAWNDIEHFDFAGGTSLTQIQVAASLLGGTAGNDHLVGTFRTDVLDGGAGNDLLEGGDEADIYVFGLGYGQDEIRETVTEAILSEQDQLRFGPGITLEDLAFARDGSDLVITIIGTSDVLTITGQFDYYAWYTWWDVDQFRFDDGSILSKEDVQQIILTPTAGNDHMVGFMTPDTLDGGAGNDLLEGGDNGDTYAFGIGYGQDEIRESVGEAGLSEDDTILFGAGVAWSDLTFTRDGDDLIIAIGGTTDTLTVTRQFETINDYMTATWWDVENFDFADGTHKTSADVMVELVRSQSGDGDDHIVGLYGDDAISGGLGDDLMEGGRGADTYVHNIGDGDDVVSDYVNFWGSGGDRILFGAGIAAADVTVRRSTTNPSDVVLSVLGGDSSVTLTNQFSGGGEWTIDLVEFADGTIWTKEQLANLIVSGSATSGDDVIDGTGFNDDIQGGAGNDVIRGNGGNDRLDGGAGNDRLEGSYGNDIYVYALGGGNDVVAQPGWWGAFDIVELGAGLNVADLVVARSGTGGPDMLLSFAGVTGSITVQGQFGSSDAAIDELHFADGTVLTAAALNSRYLASISTSGADTIRGSFMDDSVTGLGGDDLIYGNGGNDRLDGSAGNDRLEGSYGNDTYVYTLGGGNDIVAQLGWYGAFDVVEFGAGLAPADLIVSRSTGGGADMILSFAGVTGSITVQGQFGSLDAAVDELHFANGTVLNAAAFNALYLASISTSGADTILGSYMDDNVAGLGGNDLIYGNGGNDRLDGGAGNDRLEGWYGNDTYVYALGGGNDIVTQVGWYGAFDVIELGAGITPAGIGFNANASDLSDVVITFAAGGSILIDDQLNSDRNIDELRFADGTVWNAAAILAEYAARQGSAGDDFIGGTGNCETLTGGAGSDVIRAQSGNDILIGGTGNDQLEGGEGSDTYRYAAGDGDDVIFDQWGSRDNRILFGAGITADDLILSRRAEDATDLRITFKTMTGSIVIDHETWSDAGVEILEFADGTTLSGAALAAKIGAGTSGDDVIAGTAGNDEIWALEGVDRVTGMGGSDVLMGGSGNDVLTGDGFSPTGGNLLVNGSFETSGTIVGSGGWGKANSDLPGWTRTNSQPFEQVYSGIAGIYATDGTYWFDTDSAGGSGSNMDISQTIEDLDAGAVMILKFDHANSTSLESGTFEVYWNGVLVATIAETGANMRTKTFELVAVEGDNVLGFRGTGSAENSGAAIDNVRLYATEGLSGDDTLIGGGGADLLTGGAGADIFSFGTGDSGTGAAADRIADFLSGTDKIDLSGIDANSGAGGNQAFTFIGTDAFTATAGELRYNFNGTDTHVKADLDGDGAADFEIILSGAVTPLVTDFVL